MKFKLTLFLLLINLSVRSQNTIFKVKDNYWRISSKIESNQDPNKKFKIKFSNIDNGKYYIFNRLLYGNKSAKAMVYFKEFDIYVIREPFALKYLTFKEAFPKGGFYKDGSIKTIFGQKAERYSLDNDVLDFKIWISDGTSFNDNFVKFLNEVGLLKNVPSNKKIIAISIQGLELDMSEIEMKSEKGGAASYLNDVLVTFLDKEKIVEKCRDSIYKTNNINLEELATKEPMNFQYKVNQNNIFYETYYKKTSNSNNTFYSSDDGKLLLYVLPESDGLDYDARLFNYNLKKIIDCKLIDDKLKPIRTIELKSDDCDIVAPKLISKTENINFYYSTKNSQFYLIKYEIDEKNFPQYTNWNVKNGFIKKYVALDKDLNSQTVTRELEKGIFTFKFDKE